MNTNPAPVNANDLPEPTAPTKPNAILRWGIALIVIIAFFFSGFGIAKATIDPEVVTNTVDKEVIKEVVPQSCASALRAYETYGKNLDSMVYSYNEFVDNLEGEFNGNPTPQSTYEALGMTIGLSRELADEQTDIINVQVPECNKFL